MSQDPKYMRVAMEVGFINFDLRINLLGDTNSFQVTMNEIAMNEAIFSIKLS